MRSNAMRLVQPQVSFVPIKPGNYPLYVGNVPLSLGRPMGEAGVQKQVNM